MRACFHGGHSRDFCDHAHDSLEDLLAAYARQGFAVVALTEHMPPLSNRWRYADEVALGRDAAWMAGRFAAYVQKARQLRSQYAGRMQVLVGMETEWYAHAGPWIAQLRQLYALDMVVGSVHHVNGVCFDSSPESYTQAQAAAGGLVELYQAYFDAQLELLESVQPEVVGHLDLIRIFDPQWQETLMRPEVWTRVRRNLQAVRDLGVVLEANVAAWRKGAPEVYPWTPVVEAARDMGIAIVYSDDAHAVAHVGLGWERLDAHLRALGMEPSVAGPQGSWPVWRAMPATGCGWR